MTATLKTKQLIKLTKNEKNKLKRRKIEPTLLPGATVL